MIKTITTTIFLLVLVAVAYASTPFTKTITIGATGTDSVNFEPAPKKALNNWMPTEGRSLLIVADNDIYLSWYTNVLVKGFAGYESNYFNTVYATNIFNVTNVVGSVTNVVVTTNAWTTNDYTYVGYGSYTNTFDPDSKLLEKDDVLSISFGEKVPPNTIFVSGTNGTKITITAKD